ncbi:MAG: DUF3034 family protein [Pseudomonadota bacterium]
MTKPYHPCRQPDHEPVTAPVASVGIARASSTSRRRLAWQAGAVLMAGAALWSADSAHAGDRLLATWGVTAVDGTAGGGLTPWAVIAGGGSSDQIGGSASVTEVKTRDHRLRVASAAVGIRDRVELSMARWSFKVSEDVIPGGKGLEMSVLGAKVKVAGDAVYAQDSWMPQISVGALYKMADDVDFLKAVGLPIRSDEDLELYASATKVWLGALAGYNVLGNVTLRWTRANQFGLLGFGSDFEPDHHLKVEGSLGVMLRDDLVLGGEFRSKPDNFGAVPGFEEDDAYDLFLAWFPHRHVSLTAAWVDLGNIATKKKQRGWYLSGQLTF